jgi:hypothetical protein
MEPEINYYKQKTKPLVAIPKLSPVKQSQVVYMMYVLSTPRSCGKFLTIRFSDRNFPWTFHVCMWSTYSAKDEFLNL